MATMLRARDAGVSILVNVDGTSDLAGATAVIKFQRPSGLLTKAATVTGRQLSYVTTAADFPDAGTVQVQAQITLLSGVSRHTGRTSFTVDGTL